MEYDKTIITKLNNILNSLYDIQYIPIKKPTDIILGPYYDKTIMIITTIIAFIIDTLEISLGDFEAGLNIKNSDKYTYYYQLYGKSKFFTTYTYNFYQDVASLWNNIMLKYANDVDKQIQLNYNTEITNNTEYNNKYKTLIDANKKISATFYFYPERKYVSTTQNTTNPVTNTTTNPVTNTTTFSQVSRGCVCQPCENKCPSCNEDSYYKIKKNTALGAGIPIAIVLLIMIIGFIIHMWGHRSFNFSRTGRYNRTRYNNSPYSY